MTFALTQRSKPYKKPKNLIFQIWTESFSLKKERKTTKNKHKAVLVHNALYKQGWNRNNAQNHYSLSWFRIVRAVRILFAKIYENIQVFLQFSSFRKEKRARQLKKAERIRIIEKKVIDKGVNVEGLRVKRRKNQKTSVKAANLG